MNTLHMHNSMGLLLDRIRIKQEEVRRWLESYEGAKELPLYSSVDIRDAGFKAAVVDTNIFPSGFNNVCEHGLADSEGLMRAAIHKRAPGGKNILIIAEEHTRNTWYLENVRILQQVIAKAGFNVKIATFLDAQPAFCEKDKSVELKTATGESVRIHCFKHILAEYQAGREKFDLIIMNNDLTGGIPEVLKNSKVPIYPSIQAGWHSRLKSHHFDHTRDLMHEFGRIIDVDPWLFSCLFNSVGDVDINAETDRAKLAAAAEELFTKIRNKYDEHRIPEKPYIFVKSDSGTYGMGIHTIEHPEEIVHISRKVRNKLNVGKGGKVIHRYLLQEGVPTIYSIGQEICEVCIYQIENKMIGGFYRSHSDRGQRDNLNTRGMEFKKMCPHLSKYGDCGVHHDVNVFDVYRILARTAGIAAHREIIQLEANTQ